MVRSMTGFGRGERLESDPRVTVEIHSVNHRFLEVSTRLPRRLAALENKIRERLQSRVVRGKVHLAVTMDGDSVGTAALQVNEEVAQRYVEIFDRLRQRFALRGELDLPTLLGLPDVLTREESELSEAAAWELLDPPLRQALDSYDASRQREGEALARDLLARIEALRACTDRIERLNPQVVERVRDRLRDRLAQISQDVEYNRFRMEAEMATFADRTDVTEECVRLRSHLDQFAAAFADAEPAGRRLNFLLQEMNREANTIASKCQGLEVMGDLIFIREEIEKIRQQVQNVE
jgi:uncharacterized protein (TIGR00255 family)